MEKRLKKVKRYLGRGSPAIRVSNEMKEIINYIKAKYLLEGKTPPSSRTITKAIAKKVDKDRLLQDDFIKF